MLFKDIEFVRREDTTAKLEGDLYKKYSYYVLNEKALNDLIVKLEELKKNNWKLLIKEILKTAPVPGSIDDWMSSRRIASGPIIGDPNTWLSAEFVESEYKNTRSVTSGQQAKPADKKELKETHIARPTTPTQQAMKVFTPSLVHTEKHEVKETKDSKNWRVLDKFDFKGLRFEIDQTNHGIGVDIKASGRVWCPYLSLAQTEKITEIAAIEDKVKYIIAQCEKAGRKFNDIASPEIREFFISFAQPRSSMGMRA